MASEVARPSSRQWAGIGGFVGRATGHSVSLLVYLVVQVCLLVGMVLTPKAVSGLMALTIGVAGTVTFAVGVLRRRPRPRLGWWLLAAGVGLQLGAAVAYSFVYGLRADATISALVPAGLAALALLVLASGLALLGRLTPRGGPADALDAVMIALGVFLLLWAFVIDPAVESDAATAVAAIVYPVGGLLVFTTAVKLMLGGGLRDPAIRLVLLGMAAFLASSLVVLLPALTTASLQSGQLSGLLWAVYEILMGAAGLHPALGLSRGRRDERDEKDMSAWRMALFTLLALLVPSAWMLRLVDAKERVPDDVVGFSIPAVTSAVLLLLLVARLGLIARLAQRRAGQLGRRSEALAEALAEQQELQRQLSHRGLHDSLTGLPNRSMLAERMEWALSRRTGTQQHALLLLDLDGFKDVNDTLGHSVGDALIVEVSHRLLETAPADATVARLGGDEFAILLEDTEPDQARALSDEIVAALRRGHHVAHRELFATASAGLLTVDTVRRQATPSEALRDADLALYAAKGDGKDRVAVFHPGLSATRLDYTRISTGLRRALLDDEFVLRYQPIVELATGVVVGVEALLRWQPQGGAMVSPTEFVPVAEDTGLIKPIGAWALGEACREARKWCQHSGFSVSVNVSARQLDDPDFTETVAAAMAEAGLPGTSLIVEVTESGLLATNDSGAVHARLQHLRSLGVRIAIDDFGTGYSSLSYVSRLPVDIVKIDRSFVQSPRGSGLGPRDWRFTRAILNLVESLRLVAIAEGVETIEQADALRSMDCPLAQGYLFSKPVPAAVIDRALAVPDGRLTGAFRLTPAGEPPLRSWPVNDKTTAYSGNGGRSFALDGRGRHGDNGS